MKTLVQRKEVYASMVAQNFQCISILLYTVSNQKAHHGWTERKVFNVRVPRWLEKAVLGVFAVKGMQKEYPNVLSRRTNVAPLTSIGVGRGGTAQLPPCRRGL